MLRWGLRLEITEGSDSAAESLATGSGCRGLETAIRRIHNDECSCAIGKMDRHSKRKPARLLRCAQLLRAENSPRKASFAAGKKIVAAKNQKKRLPLRSSHDIAIPKAMGCNPCLWPRTRTTRPPCDHPPTFSYLVTSDPAA